MAILNLTQFQQMSAGFGPLPLVAPGTYIGVILDNRDEFAVDRPKFNNREERESVDLTRFLAGILCRGGEPQLVQSSGMKITLDPRSALITFLSGYLGRVPESGFDCASLVGMPGLITVIQATTRRGEDYCKFIAISALPPTMASLGPRLEDFNPLLAQLRSSQRAAQAAPPVPVRPPAPAAPLAALTLAQAQQYLQQQGVGSLPSNPSSSAPSKATHPAPRSKIPFC